MNKFFAQNKIEKILNKVLTNNSLNVLYNMSNSCDFLVKQCLGKDKKRYILKIMKRKSDVLRQQFINEIFINIFLGKSFFKNFPYQVVDYNIEKGEEFFLYEMIEGRTLNGYYFLIGERNKKRYHSREVVDLIFLLQKQTNIFQRKNPRVKLLKRDYKNSLNLFLRHQKISEKYFDKKLIFLVQKIIEKNKNLLNENLVLSHGDLNPKNILIKNNGKITLIDWTGVELNNPLSDFTRFYFSNWNIREKQQELKNEIFKRSNDERLFNINILILTGSFLKILEDSLKGINDDFQKNIINKDIKEKITNKIKQAEVSAIRQFKKSLNFKYD